MRKTPELLEKRRLGEIAREYEKRGYTVLLEPKGSDLPEFLRGLRPDLIARNVEESVVVEVKSQASLVRDAQLARLTEVVSSRPGRRLELVVTNPMKSLLSDTYRVLDDSQIRARLQEARAPMPVAVRLQCSCSGRRLRPCCAELHKKNPSDSKWIVLVIF